MPENKKPGTESKNDTLAFINGGIFILGLVFSTYNYFASKNGNDLDGENQGSRLSLEDLKETL